MSIVPLRRTLRYGTQGPAYLPPPKFRLNDLLPTEIDSAISSRKSVPLVYGYGYIEARAILIGTVSPLSDTKGTYYKCPVWWCICLGKVLIGKSGLWDYNIKMENTLANTMACTPDLNHGSDGTETNHPTKDEMFLSGDANYATINDNYLTRLPGIAHVFAGYPESGNPRAGREFPVLSSDLKLPKAKFIIYRDLSGLHTFSASQGAGKWANDLYIGSDYIGNNPAAVIYDILTNKQWGIGESDSNIDFASFEAVGNYFASAEAVTAFRVYGLSFTIREQVSAREVLDKILACTDIILYEKNNMFYLNRLYDAAATAKGVLIDADFKSFSITRQTWGDVYNAFEGTYLHLVSAGIEYQETKITVENEAAITMANGVINRTTVDLSYIVNSDVASQRINEIMQRESYPKIYVSCSTDRRYYDLNPGDLINIVNTEYNVSGVFRIVNMDFGGIDDLEIKLDLVQAYEQLNDGNFVSIPSPDLIETSYIPPTIIQGQVAVGSESYPQYQGTDVDPDVPGQTIIQGVV